MINAAHHTDFNIPCGTYFSKRHTWIRKNEYGLIKIGIDEILLRTFESVVVKQILATEKTVRAGETFVQIQTDMRLIDLPSPIDGTVKFINSDLKKITDPYGDDWIMLVSAFDFPESKKNLISREDFIDFKNSHDPGTLEKILQEIEYGG